MIYVLWAELDDDLFVLLHIACGLALCPQLRGGRTSSLRAGDAM